MFCRADYKYFNKARQAAHFSDYKKTHVGCVAIYQGRVVGVGYNSNKTHPVQDFYNKYRKRSESMLSKLHAEISCLNQIRNLNINFSKVKLYIYRVRRNQPHGMARPCPSCMAAIKDLGVKEIYYTTNEGYSYERIKQKTKEVLRNL